MRPVRIANCAGFYGDRLAAARETVDGVASSTRPDPQAKGPGEYLRSRVVDVHEDLL